MAVRRYYAKETSRMSPINFVNNVKGNEEFGKLPFMETRLILSLLGGIPCLPHHPYWPSWNLRKSSSLYCVLIYSLASFNAAWTIALKLQQYGKTDPNDLVMRYLHLELIAILLPHFLGLIMWRDTSDLSNTMESFIDIQKKFYQATGKQLVGRRRGMERFLNALVLLSLITFHVFSQNFIPILFVEITTGIALIYSNLLMFLITFYWIGMSVSMTDAFDDAQTAFKKLVKDKKLTPHGIWKFRLLWLSLRAEMDCMGRLYAPAAIYSISLLLIVVVLYEGASFFQIDEILAGAGHLLGAAFYLAFVGVTCIASDRAQRKMKNLVNNVLPNIMLSSYDIGTQREIVMLYMTESARPAVSTFRGFTVVNKNLILAFLSNISTYIIVLLQFREEI